MKTIVPVTGAFIALLFNGAVLAAAPPALNLLSPLEDQVIQLQMSG